MELAERFKRLWQLSAMPEFVAPIVEDDPEGPSVFVEFPCACTHPIHVHSTPIEGQAVVTTCDNCGEKWAVYRPPLVIRKVAEFEPIWKHIGQ